MYKKFGKLLKTLISLSNTKENILSELLGYDRTYISKWVSGKKLPSERNIVVICDKLSEYFLTNIEKSLFISSGLDTSCDLPTINKLLINAYYSDIGLANIDINNNKNISVITSCEDTYRLIINTINHLLLSGISEISMLTTGNIFKIFDYQLINLINKINSTNLHRLNINTLVYDYEISENPLQFCNNVFNIISGNYFIDFNIFSCDEKIPCFMVVNNVLAINFVFYSDEKYLCYYSFDKEYIELIQNKNSIVIRKLDKTMSYVPPLSLRKTNVQKNSYSQPEHRLLFVEAPTILIPPKVLSEIAEHNNLNLDNNELLEHKKYLSRISNTFENHTKKNKVDIFVFESIFVNYINTGNIEIGGQKHKFSLEMVHEHIKYLCECMKNNCKIRFFIIFDTMDIKNNDNIMPSIFLALNMVALGRTNIYSDKLSTNFYFSTEKTILNAFDIYLNNIISQSNCIEIKPKDIMKYIE